jgi:hypothetical protein
VRQSLIGSSSLSGIRPAGSSASFETTSRQRSVRRLDQTRDFSNERPAGLGVSAIRATAREKDDGIMSK